MYNLRELRAALSSPMKNDDARLTPEMLFFLAGGKLNKMGRSKVSEGLRKKVLLINLMARIGEAIRAQWMLDDDDGDEEEVELLA
ncbi:hypothetical protein QR680_016294 [Steinernema hermaphroditum]|uniref:Uncharacterized protein n=1 Tax=Steinernema hermaphroditum TaxID=289476 RepID=A0AA39LLQ9_9BILA|nr:hypothetical protein QR680_016294 [Steinernema hermaphroditum]